MITKEAKAKYLKGEACTCPACDSDNVEWESFRVFDGTARQPAYCTDCDLSWDEIYTLTDIEETDQ